VDEAPGVKAEIWEAIEGIRAGGDVRVLALGNPTMASGPFYDAFATNRDGWKTFTISAFDSPNLAGFNLDRLLALPEGELDRNARPYLVTRRWVREKFHEWGVGHPLWEARVLGQFPVQAEDALISLAWLEAAARRRALDSGGPVIAGLDVAGPGEDETVLAIRQGPNVLFIRAWAHADARGEVAAALAPYRGRIEVVNVDSVGIGYYAGKHLEDLGYPVRLVNVGEAASDSERYRNLKAEFWWGLRLRFEHGDISGLEDERTIGQLAGMRYKHNARGQVEIERKDEALKRGVKSPDRAEALMLACAAPRVTQILTMTAVDLFTERPVAPHDEQLRSAFPFLEPEERSTCGDCSYLERRSGKPAWCTLRHLIVQTSDVACSWFGADLG
jgi:hypothetical protein